MKCACGRLRRFHDFPFSFADEEAVATKDKRNETVNKKQWQQGQKLIQNVM